MKRIGWTLLGISIPYLLSRIWTNDWAIIGCILLANIVGYLQGVLSDD